jgi:hypothetical protein
LGTALFASFDDAAPPHADKVKVKEVLRPAIKALTDGKASGSTAMKDASENLLGLKGRFGKW